MLILSPDNTPHMQMAQAQQQQHLLQQQQAQARRAMMAQQFGNGMPIGMPNGMNGMNPAQFQAMRGGPNMRPVPLPQHLQQQQQQVLAQEQAQQAAQQQQVILYSNAVEYCLLR
jgi:hypothetical protein